MKEKIKLVIVFILGIMISVVISVYAATVIGVGEVSYTPGKVSASNVQDAIDGVYDNANSIAGTLNNIGIVYQGSCSNKNVSSATTTQLCSISLPAGKYIVYGTHQWSGTLFNGLYNDIIHNTTNNNTYVIRADGGNGGGSN